MVSFQQQWEAAINAETSGRPRSPLRHAAMLLAIALVLITVPTIALARATDSDSHVRRSCGVVRKVVAAAEQDGTSCHRVHVTLSHGRPGQRFDSPPSRRAPRPFARPGSTAGADLGARRPVA